MNSPNALVKSVVPTVLRSVSATAKDAMRAIECLMPELRSGLPLFAKPSMTSHSSDPDSPVSLTSRLVKPRKRSTIAVISCVVTRVQLEPDRRFHRLGLSDTFNERMICELFGGSS